MEASSALVIKARYGDILRRFNVKVVDLSMHRLIEKIFSLFKFAADASIMLTYVDEDGDSVALVDDDDLNDVAKQSLNPLRITVTVTVKLNAEKTGASHPSMWMPLKQFQELKTGNPPLTQFELMTNEKTAIPFDSSRAKVLFQCPNHEVSEILETAPPYLHEKVMKLLPGSKNRDWSDVDTVVKILSSDQKMIDCSDMIPPGSTLCEEIRSKRWLVYVLDAGKKESFKTSSVKRHERILLEQMREERGGGFSADCFRGWDPSRSKLLFQCPNYQVPEVLETMSPQIRNKLMKLWTESKDRDWSEVDDVVKVLSSDQKRVADYSGYSGGLTPASSTCPDGRTRRWFFYVLEGRKEERYRII